MQPMAAFAAAFMLTMQSTALRPARGPPRLRGLLRAAATSEDLLAEAAALRREANAMEADLEAELAPPPAPAPKPKPTPHSHSGTGSRHGRDQSKGLNQIAFLDILLSE